MKRRTFLRTALWFPIASSAAMSLTAGLVEETKVRPKRAGAMTAGLNPAITSIPCLRCKTEFPVASGVMDTGAGCPSCLLQGYPANVTFAYSKVTAAAFGGRGTGITRFRNLLPLLDFPTLGEGNTPLLPLATLARSLGLGELHAKDESRAPTGSHKDRTSGLIVARARELKRPGVIAASSGNGGHSLAAYAGSAGVPCVILSKKNLSGPWKQAVVATGARLIITETSEDRWKVMKEMVEKEGWYPFTNYLSPPVGSNPFAVQGCKTIAHEISEQLGGNAPDAVLVPTCRGDLLWGLYEGFCEARTAGLITRVPRLYAIEPYPRLERILAGLDYRTVFTQPDHPMVSIGGTSSAYQALSAVRLSQGGACSVTTAATFHARSVLAALGLYLELSSAAGLAGLYHLVKSGTIRKGARVVLLCTSHGYKQL